MNPEPRGRGARLADGIREGLAAIQAVRGWLRQGRRAYLRAPWLFSGFTLMGGSAQLLGQAVQNRASDALAVGEEPVTVSIGLVLAGLVLSVGSLLWLNVGLLRGAWIALDGRTPQLAELVRWQTAAMGRLLGALLLLLLLNLLILATAGLAAGLVSLIHPLLALVPLLIGGTLLVALFVTQIFHLPLAVAGGLSPVATFRHGRILVPSHGWELLALSLSLVLIVLLPLGLALLIAWPLAAGLLVTWPLALCSLTAGYQGIVDAEDRGSLAGAV
ncbi:MULTISPECIES: hypothetical protein [unclassified Synechococcus]|uniref:hypothetical protein n=1 Tax=unclassified Synechococcus TaxID=2626047 RepID=UPI0000699476|nr:MULTISPECIES: hypothetical protein [unclassified Synechococcus]EAQ76136.1 hypothetical protein WH5701_15056 [Synechococcus sp. WH 5701]WFN58845.1 hypothetical protein N4320_13850 [Synechococcus sp. CCFWC 502]